jgi:hypothetical protein
MNRSLLLCTSVVGTFVLATAASANCPPSDHDCFTTGIAGCTDVECCKIVCAADPFCCDVSWDGLCVNGAINLCGGGGGDCPPAANDCFTTGGPGCSDVECCLIVCSFDPFCCDVAWDGLCVNGALDACDGGEPGDCPPAANDCFTTGGPGCSDVECCLIVCAFDPFCCDVAWDGLCVNGAIQSCDGEPGDCPPATNDCFTTGGPGCSDVECCLIVCSFDPFCCDVAWDGLCVNGAIDACDGPSDDCPKSDHDCFTTGGPGCTDVECCLAVCSFDPFCCDVAWDSLCVNGAIDACGAPPCPWDLNGDGAVDGADLGILLQNWGNPYDGADLGDLLNAWGPCP